MYGVSLVSKQGCSANHYVEFLAFSLYKRDMALGLVWRLVLLLEKVRTLN